MKRILLALCLTAFTSLALRAQNATPADLEHAVKYLKETQAGVVAATKGLSEAQWNFKPGPTRWSVAEVTEHIAAAEDLLMGMIQGQVMKSPVTAAAADPKATDDMILQMLPDRSKKLQAPEPLIPNNRFGTPKDALKHFAESRAGTIKFVQETKDLRGHVLDSPLGKPLDAYQWVLFIAGHSARHTKQILEVEADPNFPKK